LRQNLNSGGDPGTVTLAQARSGSRYHVLTVQGDDLLADRLAAAGVWPGAVVESLGNALFGDPMLFKLHGFRLALRRMEAERVAVTLVPAAGGAER